MRPTMLTLALLTACGSPPSELPTQAGPSFAVLLEGSALVEGEAFTLTVPGIPPTARVTFGASAQAGAGPCPSILAGDCLGILPPVQLLGSARADSTGTATFTIPSIPSPFPLDAIQLQAVVRHNGNAIATNVLERVLNDANLNGIPDDQEVDTADTGETGDTDTDTLVDTGPFVDDTTDTGTGDSAPPDWSHTITVDGDASDWLPAETFDTTSGTGTTTYVTWDADNLYVGVQHPDVSAGGVQNWVIVTFGDGFSGNTTCTTLGTQTPERALGCDFQLRWKADDSYSDLARWDSGRSMWTYDATWETTWGGAHAESNANGFVEFKIPFAAINITNSWDMNVHWAFEGAGSESSYGATPTNSFWPLGEGAYDPDLTNALLFEQGHLGPQGGVNIP